MDLTRRQALVKMAVAMGAAFVGPRLLAAEFHSGAGAAGSRLADDEVALLDEIADTILPDTKVPGAKAAKAGECIALLVRDCFEPEERAVFAAGLAIITAAYEKRFGTGFGQGRPADRLAFLNDYNRTIPGQSTTASRAKEPRDWQCFRHLKQLTLLAYFTSEIGCTQALRYVETPGGYDGNAPYKPGDRNWFIQVR